MDQTITRHFIHDHPLTFFEEEGDADYKPNSICSMCALPILLSPSYACTRPTCPDFILHQPCAHLLQIIPYPRDPLLQYELNSTPPNADSKCIKCRKLIQNFTYILRGPPYMKFYLHPLCAQLVEIKSKHKSHPQHPLVAIRKEITCECDACGAKHEGIFLTCAECNFSIHKDCASAPSFVKHVSHPHPLILTYGFSDLYSRYKCYLCRETIFGQGLYFCGCCFEMYHMKCVSSNMEILNSESLQDYWIHLPSERDRFPNSIKNFSEYVNGDDRMKNLQKIKKCRNNHPLIFHEKYPGDGPDGDGDEDELVCNGCGQPIPKTSPIWGCFEPGCDFLLHHFCATNIPSIIENYFRIFSLSIHEPGKLENFFCSVFFCYLCARPYNGFGCSLLSLIHVCIECALSPRVATHGSHHGGAGQHILFITTPDYNRTISFTTSGSRTYMCCSRKYNTSILALSYSCVTCDFKMHVGCALLPKKASHEFDKHLLELVFTDDEKSFKKLEDYDCFCEFCEEDIDQRYWFYRCAECEHSFHVKCVPSVGLLSNVKFGGRLNIPNIHPRHPVILTRMLMEGNQRCDYCRKIIDGFVDDMAFRCDECDFWIHFRCARDCSSADRHATRLWCDLPAYLFPH